MERIRENNINTVEYWDSFANDAYTEADRNRGGNRCKFTAVLENITRDVKILDVGCLNGNFYNFLKEHEYRINSFTGLDLSPQLIDLAKSRFPEQTWHVGSCYELPYDSDTFDVVTAMEILEHVDEPAQAINELKRVTKPSGCVIITVPNELKIDDQAHVWSYTQTDIFNLLSKISQHVKIQLVCSNNRNILGKALIT